MQNMNFPYSRKCAYLSCNLLPNVLKRYILKDCPPYHGIPFLFSVMSITSLFSVSVPGKLIRGHDCACFLHWCPCWGPITNASWSWKMLFVTRRTKFPHWMFAVDNKIYHMTCKGVGVSSPLFLHRVVCSISKRLQDNIRNYNSHETFPAKLAREWTTFSHNAQLAKLLSNLAIVKTLIVTSVSFLWNLYRCLAKREKFLTLGSVSFCLPSTHDL